MTGSPSPALSLTDLSKEFGGLRALDGVSLAVGSGERRAIIGPNGAGKTTLFSLISGETPPTDRRVGLFGPGVTRFSPHPRPPPRLLLLDEPTAGLSPAESHAMTALLKNLDPAITLLVIEHDMDVAFALTDRITVLHYGKVVADGLAHEVKASSLVQEIYLGAS